MYNGELRDLHAYAKKVFDDDTIDWELKYDLIFNENVSRRVFSLTQLDYYDPDTTYQEDVTAFMNAFDDEMARRTATNT